MNIVIYRFNPEVDKMPHQQEYELNTNDVRGNMLLDAIRHIKQKVDSSLGFRSSCGEGVCGSDAMNINGKNGLACVTPLDSLPEKVVIKPLPGLPVIRDLIVDMSKFYAQYEKAQPYLQNDDVPASGERLQSIEERSELDGLYECILCACCTTSCPSYWWNPDEFLGPAALLWAQRFITDSRDNKTAERLEMLENAYSLFRCRSIMNCVDACPKGLNPTKAIGHIRKKMLKDAV